MARIPRSAAKIKRPQYTEECPFEHGLRVDFAHGDIRVSGPRVAPPNPRVNAFPQDSPLEFGQTVFACEIISD
jgi:hypothetical protein